MKRKYILKGDLHIHTDCSYTLPVSKRPHVFYSPEQAVQQAAKIGLDFIAITDHDSIGGVKKAQKEAERIFKKTAKRIFVIPGQETTTSFLQIAGINLPIPGAHILAYGIKKRIPPFLPIGETVKLIHDQDGLAVAAHPFHRGTISIRGKIAKFPFDGLEVYNACNRVRGDKKAKHYAKKLNLLEFGGSDAHLLSVIGKGLMVIESKAQVKSWQEVLKLICQGKGKVVPNGPGGKILKKRDVFKGLFGNYQRAS